MLYENAGQLDRALKKAIKSAGGDPGEGYRQMLRDRFLCRVFSDPHGRFVLKGGSSLLARIPDARATKDIDFATSLRESPDTALASLNALVGQDMGDFCAFELTKRQETLDENGYSRLLKLRYSTKVGLEEKDPILIDLSLDCSTTLPPERVSPVNRFEVDGVRTCDYLLYPLPDQLADKFCAIMELQPSGWPSSRMKDLVDVVAYATNQEFSLSQLSLAIQCECRRREMHIPESFKAPEMWKPRFSAFAKKSKVSKEFATFESASALASKFFNPALSAELAGEMRWDPKSLLWRT